MPLETPADKALSDFPPSRGGLWIVLGWLAVTVVLALCMAASIEQRGANRFTSVLCGAAGATVIVVFTLTLYGAVRRSVWKYTRSYPFRVGDTVVVTSGPFRGEQGRIVKYWQGEVDFKVTLGADAAAKSIWFRATELRKLSP